LKLSKLAIVGATGAVGKELLAILEEREFACDEVQLFASEASQGKAAQFRGQELRMRALQPDSFQDIDLAFFSAGGDLSREFVPRAVEQGAVVIDNSSAFRLDPEVPLVVPEWNSAALAAHAGIIANPNCSTIIMIMAIAPLHSAIRLKRVQAATYQAASGAGQRALEELRSATAAALSGDSFVPRVLDHNIAFNLLARIDRFGPDGYTREEDKMLNETRKILDCSVPVEATCVRVPVERCHSMSLSLEFEGEFTVERARQVLASAPGLELEDSPADDLFPQPAGRAGSDAVAIGRIRESRIYPGGLVLWAVGDQLRKGAALNAVQIAEELR
jgi:aspartate-semialdehyde dehydrogenase